MINVVDNYCKFPVVLRRPMWQVWHKLLIRFDKDITANFMNYGYANLNGEKVIELEKVDEKNRYCIQLYDHVVSGIDLKNKNVVEVGSGRGGGAYYIAKYYKPSTYKGIDISKSVISFCNQYYNISGLSFIEGRAEKLPVASENYDAVVNVESARCYSNLDIFFNEVHRILRPEGHFLFADMMERNRINEIRKKLTNCGFLIQKETDITRNVALGLELDAIRRETLIQHKVPGIMKNFFRSFAGTKGTKRFESFNNGKFEYWSMVLTKKQLV